MLFPIWQHWNRNIHSWLLSTGQPKVGGTKSFLVFLMCIREICTLMLACFPCRCSQTYCSLDLPGIWRRGTYWYHSDACGQGVYALCQSSYFVVEKSIPSMNFSRVSPMIPVELTSKWEESWLAWAETNAGLLLWLDSSRWIPSSFAWAHAGSSISYALVVQKETDLKFSLLSLDAGHASAKGNQGDWCHVYGAQLNWVRWVWPLSWISLCLSLWSLLWCFPLCDFIDCYVSDEIITSRAGVRVRIGNTDAEGRMAMGDVLCHMKEKVRACLPCIIVQVKLIE